MPRAILCCTLYISAGTIGCYDEHLLNCLELVIICLYRRALMPFHVDY